MPEGTYLPDGRARKMMTTSNMLEHLLGANHQHLRKQRPRESLAHSHTVGNKWRWSPTQAQPPPKLVLWAMKPIILAPGVFLPPRQPPISLQVAL